MAEVHQSVQELSTSGAVPPEFVHFEQDQPGATILQECSGKKHIPAIDMSKPDCGAGMADAATEWGCFQVVNHGVPAEVVAELRCVGRAFFDLPEEEKVQYLVAGSVEGYKVGTEGRSFLAGKKLWGDFLYHYVAPPAIVNHQIWPKNPTGYREANEEYCLHMQWLTRDLFEHLSVGLGLDKDAMREALGGDELVMLQKINFYPPCPRPDLALGASPHTDICAITILLTNDVPGLQIFKDGRWHDVDYIPGALVVLIGDQIEILSNGRYKAGMHRGLVDKENTRMSWPTFVAPPGELVIGPHHELATASSPAKYKARMYKDHQDLKLNLRPQ